MACVCVDTVELKFFTLVFKDDTVVFKDETVVLSLFSVVTCSGVINPAVPVPDIGKSEVGSCQVPSHRKYRLLVPAEGAGTNPITPSLLVVHPFMISSSVSFTPTVEII